MNERTEFGRFLSSSSAAFAMRIAATGLAFAMNVAVTRTLGPSEAGLFFLGQACLIILAMLSRFGTDHLLLRFVSGFSEKQQLGAVNAVVAKASSIVIPLAGIVATVVYWQSSRIATVVFSKPEFADVLRSVALCIVPFSGYQMLSFAIQGRRQIATSIAINAAVLPLSILVATVLAHRLAIESATDLMMFVVGVCSVNAVIAVLIWFRRTSLTSSPELVPWPDVTSTAYPLFLVSVFSLANLWAPQLILAMFQSADQIAMLSNSQKTATLVGLLLIAINAAAAPTYAVLHSRQHDHVLQEFAARVNGVILLATTPILAVVFVFAPQILSIFGPTFSTASWLLRILVIGQFVNAATGSVGYLLTMSGNARHFRNATGWAAVASVSLSVLLIPFYGAMGAAIAMSIACTVANVLAARKVYQCLGVNVLKPNVEFVFGFLKRATA